MKIEVISLNKNMSSDVITHNVFRKFKIPDILVLDIMILLLLI